MKIVSWNILADEFIEKPDYAMISQQVLFNRTERQDHIMQILYGLDADIMLLQEVMQAEYDLLVKIFGQRFTIIRGANMCWYNKPSQSGNVTLLRKTFFRDIQAMDLDFGLVVKCRALKRGPLTIINVHLDDRSYRKRISSIESLAPFVSVEPRVILGGDFNQEYRFDSKLYAVIQTMGFQTYPVKGATYYIEKNMAIDHVMTKGLTGQEMQQVNNFNNDIFQQFKTYGSDHLPILLKLN
jgi:endonuclease/exonuclease/phosphatase family metal-dependent hydrolase